MRKIVCAASKHDISKTIVLGVRHFDKLMHDQINLMDKLMDKLNLNMVAGGGHIWIQGFVDNGGKFLTREEALKVAIEANQLIRKTQPEDQLFSEDLY